MKKNLFVFVVSAVIVMLASCAKEDFVNVDGVQVRKSVVEAFEKQYPSANNVRWRTRVPYFVVSFDIPLSKTKLALLSAGCNTVWYDGDANCKMEELDVKHLPEVVKEAFDASPYKDFTVDDIDMISRDGFGVIYVIEVKDASGKLDIDLYFSAEGVFLKELPDSPNDDDDDKYDTMISEIDLAKFDSFLKTRFGENYILIEADKEDDGTFEIEIVAEIDQQAKAKFEVVFDKNAKFLYDVREVNFGDLEKAVKDAIKAFIDKAYPEQDIDDIDIVRLPDGSVCFVFEVEFEKDGVEIEKDIAVKIDENGVAVEVQK